MPDYKKDADKWFPWEDEEGRKRKPSRGDSIPPKTNIQSRVHSKPKVAGQEYLDMYIMSKEKERKEKYGAVLGKQQKGVAKSWVDIKKELTRGEKELPKVPNGGIEESEATEGSPERGRGNQTDTGARQGKKIPAHMKKLDWNY